MVILRIITTGESEEQIMSFLAAGNYGTTLMDAHGSRGNVNMIFSLVNRVDAPRITEFIRTVNPHGFFSSEDVRHVNGGIFPPECTGHHCSGAQPGPASEKEVVSLWISCSFGVQHAVLRSGGSCHYHKH